MLGGNKLSPNLHPASLPLIPLSPVFSVPAQASQGCVSVCACVCGGGSNALCETKRSGRMLYDSVISLWVTYTHTRTVSQRGTAHRDSGPHTHTDQNNVFVRKENSFMGHTHGRWRPLSMPLCRTAQLSLCTSLFPLSSLSLCAFCRPLFL